MTSYDLPQDVFGPDEIRPTKAKKKTKQVPPSINKKRSFADTGIEVCLGSALPFRILMQITFRMRPTVQNVMPTVRLQQKLRAESINSLLSRSSPRLTLIHL